MKDERTAEIELFDLKWFDYRPLHPDVATLVCFLEYVRSQRTYNDDLGYTVYVNVLKSYAAKCGHAYDIRLSTWSARMQMN